MFPIERDLKTCLPRPKGKPIHGFVAASQSGSRSKKTCRSTQQREIYSCQSLANDIENFFRVAQEGLEGLKLASVGKVSGFVTKVQKKLSAENALVLRQEWDIACDPDTEGTALEEEGKRVVDQLYSCAGKLDALLEVAKAVHAIDGSLEASAAFLDAAVNKLRESGLWH